MAEHFQLSVEDLLNNPNSRVTLGLPTGKSITAWMVQDTFDISASASYEPFFQKRIAEHITDRLGGGVSRSLEAFEAITQTRIKSLSETILSYSGTDRPTFSLELVFVSLKSTDDPRAKATMLLEGCMPSKGPVEGFLYAPWNYGSLAGELAKDESGKMVIEIGTWFRAPNQILLSASFQISRETIQTGVPLYVIGAIQFKPHMQLYASQMRSYFPGLGS